MRGYTQRMNAEEIRGAIAALPPGELDALLEWIEEYRADAWDRRIEADALVGRLDALGQQADREFEAGRCRPL